MDQHFRNMASTYEDRRLAIPLLVPAVGSLVAAPPTVVRFETLTLGRRIEPPEKGKTLEVVRTQIDRIAALFT